MTSLVYNGEYCATKPDTEKLGDCGDNEYCPTDLAQWIEQHMHARRGSQFWVLHHILWGRNP